MCCHFLLQRIFLTQGSNPCLLRWQNSSPLSYLGSPQTCIALLKASSYRAWGMGNIYWNIQREDPPAWLEAPMRPPLWLYYLWKPPQRCHTNPDRLTSQSPPPTTPQGTWPEPGASTCQPLYFTLWHSHCPPGSSQPWETPGAGRPGYSFLMGKFTNLTNDRTWEQTQDFSMLAQAAVCDHCFPFSSIFWRIC